MVSGWYLKGTLPKLMPVLTPVQPWLWVWPSYGNELWDTIEVLDGDELDGTDWVYPGPDATPVHGLGVWTW